MTEPSHAVFLSYASQDAKAAQKICEALRAAGVEVWFDQSELRGGDAWDHQIRRQIKDCALFIPIISAHTQARTEGYFRLEWHLADQRKLLMTKNRPFLLPVCIDDTPAADAEVPDSFNAVQWTRLRAGATTPAFVELVSGLLSPKSTRPTNVPSQAAAPASSRIRTALPLIVVLGILGAGYLVVDRFLLSHRPAAELRSNALVAQVAMPAANVSSEKSVAVLAFVDMSEKHDQEYFADGLTEELIDHLSRSGGLRVIARTSSFYFKGRQTTIKDVANTLNVSTVLEGSVRKSGNALRISAKLIRASDGVGLWSQTFDRPFSDIFKVQSEIAAQVAGELDPVLRGAGLDLARGTPSIDAYNLVLEGRYYDSRGNTGDLARAMEAYRHAVHGDPNYAEAWVRLGYAYTRQDFREVDRTSAERAAADAAHRALAIDPKFAPAYHLIADNATYLQWNWNDAAAAYQRALALADSAERLRIQLDLQYLQALRSGRFDSTYRRLLQESLVANPLDTTLMRRLAFDYLYAGESAKSLELLEHARGINPMAESVNSAVAYVLMLMGRFEEAWAAAQFETSVEDKRQISAMLAWSLGRRAESDRLVADIERPPTDAFTNAQIRTWRGEKDQAVQWLTTAFRERSISLVGVRLDPVLRKLQADARYEALLRKMNLSDSVAMNRPAGEQK